MKKFNLKVVSLLVLCLMASVSVSAQNYKKKLKKAKSIEVTYFSSYKGEVEPGATIMKVTGDRVALRYENEGEPETPDQAQLVTKNYMDYGVMRTYNYAKLPSGRVISSNYPFEIGRGLKEQGEGKCLGLNCKIYRTSINSNTIDVWATTDVPFRGTPNSGTGVPEGLVLKIVRNGDQITEAKSIAVSKNASDLFPESWGDEMEGYEYQYAIKQSGVITVNVFDQQTVCFNGAKLPETLVDGEQYSCAGGTIILKKVKLPASAEGRSVFVEVNQYSEGDAYDRTGSIFVIPTDKKQSFIDALHNLNSVPAFKGNDGVDYHGLVSTDDYNVPLELMRFFTGFGVRQFNYIKVPGQHWVDSVNYKTEITSLAEHLQGEAWIGAYIGNWDAKGHRVSVNLKYYPRGGRGRTVNHAMPLFNTVNYIEQAGQPYPIFLINDGELKATFTLKEPVKNAQLCYITTGHGGWGGGDEFNQKPNSIYLDGQKVITFIPWRDDCGTYRNNNPCSGNFSNGLSSSDLSRSNWCPGTVTDPDYIVLGDLDAGTHTITVKIPQGQPAGSSNSYWCVSGTLIY